MKTVFDLYHWPHPDAAAEITYGYPTAEAAAEATGSTAYAWHRTANGDGWLLDATFDAARPTGNATPSSATYSTRSKPPSGRRPRTPQPQCQSRRGSWTCSPNTLTKATTMTDAASPAEDGWLDLGYTPGPTELHPDAVGVRMCAKPAPPYTWADEAAVEGAFHVTVRPRVKESGDA
ncbi:hypothetical protein [Actinocrinis sp.]|uniref:hypothetical protein n=1 Tax=Actinocrinis sp. TaxID=1920516 RepID=UPI002D31A7F1|nr:hypothetical protein [Actinocrinis sp.]HZP54340.1 hypothetical protein [Actinocrinis sp.]